MFLHRKLPVFLKKDNYLRVSYVKKRSAPSADVLRKAAMQLHIGAGSGASPSRIEGFREFEADLSALFFNRKVRHQPNVT